MKNTCSFNEDCVPISFTQPLKTFFSNVLFFIHGVRDESFDLSASRTSEVSKSDALTTTTTTITTSTTTTTTTTTQSHILLLLLLLLLYSLTTITTTTTTTQSHLLLLLLLLL